MLIAFSAVFPAILFFSSASASSNPTDRLQRHQQRIFPPSSTQSPDFQSFSYVSKLNDFTDLRVSESVSPATFSQSNSSVAPLDNGRFVIVWQDNRSGSFSIIGQVFDSTGIPTSSNSQLAGRTDGFDLIDPRVVTDGSGGFYLAWRDQPTGKIYAARYNSSLAQIVAPFMINDAPAMNYAGPFDIDSYTTTRLAVVWEDYGAENHIMLRIFSSTGAPLTDPIRINSDTEPASHWEPSVAISGTGATGVVWEDYRNGNADIFLQMVNIDGTLNGSNLGIVAAAFDDSAQYMPKIAFSLRDGYAISWLDRRNGSQLVYLQRYLPSTGLSGGNVMISDHDTLTEDWDIDLDVNSSGNLNMAWANVGVSDQILLQKFTTGFAKDGASITVNSFPTDSRWETAMRVGISNKLICSWTDYRSVNPDIYFEILTSSGSRLLAQDRIANDDLTGACATESDVVIIDDATSMVVFTSDRNDEGDIYMQMAGSAGNLMGANQKINGDSIKVLQNEPTAAVSSSKVLMVWSDSRAVSGVTGRRIFGRYISFGGVLGESDFLISDSSNVAAKRNPAVAITSDGIAMVGWVDYRSGDGKIMGRRLNSDGSPAGDIFSISNPTDSINDDLSTALDKKNNFSYVWLSRGAAAGPTVIVARYSSAGGFLNRFGFKSDMTGKDFNDISAAVNDSGDVYLFWESAGTEKHLYLTIRSSTGVVKVPSFEVNSLPSSYSTNPGISVDNERFIVLTWVDSRGAKRRTYSQIYDYNLVAVGSNNALSPEIAQYTVFPAAAARNRKAWFAWSDPRIEGLNVYVSQLSYKQVGIDDEKPTLLPTGFVLRQNYPNPFNPMTSIEFSVPTRVRVNISVYNILGQHVKVLTDMYYEAGCHNIQWDGTDAEGKPASSGIYFYKMRAGELLFSGKMILVK